MDLNSYRNGSIREIIDEVKLMIPFHKKKITNGNDLKTDDSELPEHKNRKFRGLFILITLLINSLRVGLENVEGKKRNLTENYLFST